MPKAGVGPERLVMRCEKRQIRRIQAKKEMREGKER